MVQSGPLQPKSHLRILLFSNLYTHSWKGGSFFIDKTLKAKEILSVGSGNIDYRNNSDRGKGITLTQRTGNLSHCKKTGLNLIWGS
jgi:hypothetical protein